MNTLQNINVEAVSKQKKQLQQDIARLLINFEEQTGIPVEEIAVESQRFYVEDNEKPVHKSVTVNVKLENPL